MMVVAVTVVVSSVAVPMSSRVMRVSVTTTASSSVRVAMSTTV